MLGAQKNCLIEMALLSTHNISFFAVFFLNQHPRLEAWPQGYKIIFMLNPTEHEIYHAHKC